MFNSRFGLLIIDEEQRFGVSQRNFSKKRTEVDVLTMATTPIPRTLLHGVDRCADISSINTRRTNVPIVTHVGPYSGKTGSSGDSA